ncbi:hypothetical protein IFR04_007275 [Cadophora malorum]|uniref:Uncharacterized protein n=1 Tax=Cadophora malorum TaxID=108018 RepID=A0A8H7TIU5_9HELO|nr:hypothetical protein IFR04_007275 [Cadophora malorum]
MADLPVWGEEVDKEVQRYIQGIQDVVLANVNWSFRTERYFGKKCHQVRETRVLDSGSVDWLPGVMLSENHGQDIKQATMNGAENGEVIAKSREVLPQKLEVIVA